MTTLSIYKSEAGQQRINELYDRLLTRWPVSNTQLYIPTRVGETFVIASGNASAPPLVLLHGAGSNSSSWIWDVARYAQHFRVYAVDLIGEPGKSAPARPAWNGMGYVEWFEDVAGGLGLEKTSLLGLSQGGWTALKYATHHPERIEKLVLLTPGGVVPDKMSFLLTALPLTLLGKWGHKQLLRILLAGQPLDPTFEQLMSAIFDHFKTRFGVLPIFSEQELRRLTMPVLVMVGEHDALRDGRKIIARLLDNVLNLTHHLVPNAGHALTNTAEQSLQFLLEQA